MIAISGVGIDLTPVARMEAALGNAQFMNNTFTKIEQEYCTAYQDAATHFAGTFAAKEAVRKATGLTSAFTDIEIRRAASGKPEVWLSGTRKDSIEISISHTNELATAIAVAH